MIGSDGLINVKHIYGTPLIIDLLPKKANYSKWIKKDNEYLTNHNTGNSATGANAKAHANYLLTVTTTKSWHITVDDKCIIQHLPLNVNGWHCTDGVGSDSGNMNSIGIEGCMNKDGNWEKTRQNMVKINVWLMNNLPNLVGDNWKKTIVPHKHWYNKNCPSVILAESGGFDKFVTDCIRYNTIYNTQNNSNEEYAKILELVSPKYYKTVWIPFFESNHIEGKLNLKGLFENTFNFGKEELIESEQKIFELKKDLEHIQELNNGAQDKLNKIEQIIDE